MKRTMAATITIYEGKNAAETCILMRGLHGTEIESYLLGFALQTSLM